jgi:tetratricopeptide (TPR) repeat protein
MKMFKKSNSYNPKSLSFLIGAGFFLAVSSKLNNQTVKPAVFVSRQNSALTIEAPFLSALAFGNKRLFSDVLWIKTLLESDEEHYKGDKFNNWLFLRFKTIAELDPRFYENYIYGGQYLSIVKDDVEGAAYIYNKGLQYYPKDYSLNFHSGFNYYFELGEYEKGLERFLVIQDHPKSPHYLISIINKLKVELTMDLKSALAILQQNYEMAQDETIKKKLESDIYAVKAEIDLDCLNHGNKNCSRIDAEGNSYLIDDTGKYIAPKEFQLYRIKRAERKP